MLAAAAGLSTLFFIVVSIVMGARLLLLARRTRGLPEFAMGFGLLIIAGVAYPLSLAGRGLAPESPELGRWLMASSAVPAALGWSTVWVFTREVFRPGSRACGWLVYGAIGLTGLLMVTSVHHMLTRTDLLDPARADLRLWGNSLVAMCAYVWAASESLLYWSKVRKRVAIGLADPVVANRFLLFAGVMIFSLIAVGASTFAGMAGIDTLESPATLLTVALAGTLCGLTMWLAFLPPQAYLRRVRAAA